MRKRNRKSTERIIKRPWQREALSVWHMRVRVPRPTCVSGKVDTEVLQMPPVRSVPGPSPGSGEALVSRTEQKAFVLEQRMSQPVSNRSSFSGCFDFLLQRMRGLAWLQDAFAPMALPSALAPPGPRAASLQCPGLSKTRFNFL